MPVMPKHSARPAPKNPPQPETAIQKRARLAHEQIAEKKLDPAVPALKQLMKLAGAVAAEKHPAVKKLAPAPVAKNTKPAITKPAPEPKAVKLVLPPGKELPAGFKLPKTLAECADLLYTTREKRLADQRELKKVEKQESFLTEYILANLPKSKMTGISGSYAHAERYTVEYAEVDDWAKLYAYIAKTKAWELLNKALGKAAAKERREAGKAIPGVAWHDKSVLSVTKKGK